ISIRAASVADSDAIANVCLLSAYQGRSAKTISRHPELPPQVHALPYLHLPSGFAYVLVETIDLARYVVGTGETTQFNREVEALWLPVLREKYPKDLIGTALDRHFVGLIHKGPKLTSTGPLHIQVDILNKYRGQGYDRLLVDVAMNHL
ncbi:uncharacterized protein FOMMEDRAFT_69765, partial [Fomitiporia mediterranea MF3/22]|uniref:uncharacterized protein n=1 Tax=Fomitiporia mediterranea (strain MF3/22) TaxID=694068 RepID=UPI0004408EEC